jgi:hypothetical protein
MANICFKLALIAAYNGTALYDLSRYSLFLSSSLPQLLKDERESQPKKYSLDFPRYINSTFIY